MPSVQTPPPPQLPPPPLTCPGLADDFVRPVATCPCVFIVVPEQNCILEHLANLWAELRRAALLASLARAQLTQSATVAAIAAASQLDRVGVGTEQGGRAPRSLPQRPSRLVGGSSGARIGFQHDSGDECGRYM